MQLSTKYKILKLAEMKIYIYYAELLQRYIFIHIEQFNHGKIMLLEMKREVILKGSITTQTKLRGALQRRRIKIFIVFFKHSCNH